MVREVYAARPSLLTSDMKIMIFVLATPLPGPVRLTEHRERENCSLYQENKQVGTHTMCREPEP